MKKNALLAVTLLGALTLLSLNASPVTAQSPQTPNAGQALEIAPPVITVSANPGQTINTQISLRDVSTSKLIVTGQVNDFVAGGEDGTPKILLNNDEAVNNPYSLKSWISPLPQLLLEPRQIKNLPVTIKVPKTASPGGYYAVVRFTATPPELNSTGVSLSASLGALILVRVNGDVAEKMEIAEFSVTKGDKPGSLFQSTPLEFVERIKNAGNIHDTPTGQVTITDMFGKKIATVNVNLPPRNILPQSIRKFTQPLDSSVIGNKILFGKYTADLSVVYGADKNVVTSSLTFWVIPYTLIGVGIATLVIGFFALRFLIQRYNSHIIGKSQKSRRR